MLPSTAASSSLWRCVSSASPASATPGGILAIRQRAARRLGLRRKIVQLEQQRDGLVLARLELAFDRGDLVLDGLVLAAVGDGHQLLLELGQPLLGRRDVTVARAALCLPVLDGGVERVECRA